MGKGRPPSNDGAPTVPEIRPTRPLEANESDVWAAWVQVVQATRPFLSTDAPLLTFVVDLETRKRRACECLRTVDPYAKGKRHPALTDWDNAHRDQMALLRELGLTPASLKNVKAGSKPSKEKDELDQFIDGE